MTDDDIGHMTFHRMDEGTDPDYECAPMATFVPMVRRVLARPWTPPV